MSFREWENAWIGYKVSTGVREPAALPKLTEFDHLAHLPEFTRSIRA